MTTSLTLTELREKMRLLAVGKRDPETAEGFLRSHYQKMPRTMLQNAIERFPEEKRLGYLKRPGG